MNEIIKKINAIFVVVDVLVMLAIMGVFVYTFVSFFNIDVTKTENYLNEFLFSLKIIYLLAKIAIIHVILNLAYHLFKKAREQIGGESGTF